MERLSIKKTNIFFIVYLVAYVMMSYGASYILREIGQRMTDESLYYIIVFSVAELIILIPVLFYLMVYKSNPLKWELMKLPRFWDIIWAILAALCLMPLVSLLNIITMTFTSNAVTDTVEILFSENVITQLLLMAIMPAVVEEFVFRGMFYGVYRKRNIMGGALMSGLLFGLFHLNINQCVYAVVMGVAFAIIDEISGSLITSVVAHITVNASSVLSLFFSKMADSSFDYEAYEESVVATEEMLHNLTLDGGIIIYFVMLTAFALGGLMLAICIMRHMASKNGKSEYMTIALKNSFTTFDENTDKYIDAFMIIAIIGVLTYMIYFM